ncbi:sulfatase family protein [Clostridium sp. DL1XJH146]
MITSRRPNILILYTDQQRQDTLGCYGNKYAVTPNLDKLAEKGAKFNNYFVQNPVCMPSRMSFLTGRYCSSIGIGTNGVPLDENACTVNRIVKSYGYNTAQIGKLHFQPHSRRDHKDPHPLYGFDTFILSDEPGCYDDAYIKWVENIDHDMVDKVRTSLPPAAVEFGAKVFSHIPRETHEPYVFGGRKEYTHSSFVASEMCNFLRSTDKNKPFFAIAGFYAPHTPINPPQCYIDLIEKNKLDLPLVGKDEKVMEILKDLSNDDWKEIRAYYLALVSHVDDCVGEIIKTLEEEKLSDNTLVIFTSDHGEYLIAINLTEPIYVK